MALLLHRSEVVWTSGGNSPSSLGSQVIYHCDEGLFPLDVRTSTCTDVDGRGEWVENPGSLVCRERPGEMYDYNYSCC